MSDDLPSEQEIQEKLEVMTRIVKVIDSIRIVDRETFCLKREMEEEYLAANDWLWTHGINPWYDSEQKRYIKGVG